MPETEPQLSEIVKEMEALYDHPTYFEDNYGVGNHVRCLFDVIWDHAWRECLPDVGETFRCWSDIFWCYPAKDEQQVRKRWSEEPIYL